MPDESEGWGSRLMWAWTNRAEILGYLRMIWPWFKTESGRSILIIGPGGAGKTTLARLLSGEFDWLLDEPWQYDESFGIEHYALKDDPKVSIVVPPGQTGRRETTWAEVERDLAAGRYRGIILVVANGYHMIGHRSFKTHPLFQGRQDEFFAKYLKEARLDEIAVVNRIAAALRLGTGKLWMLTVVAKEDLWWPDRQNVANFYATGDYADPLTNLTRARGERQTRHEIIPVSLVISNLVTGQGEVLAKNVEGYDHQQQVKSIRRLFELLDALRKWESTS